MGACFGEIEILRRELDSHFLLVQLAVRIARQLSAGLSLCSETFMSLADEALAKSARHKMLSRQQPRPTRHWRHLHDGC
jgi:hypothetical protein